MKTEWNYSSLAKAYLSRPSYSSEAIDQAIHAMDVEFGSPICDVGAGVAHLTIPLLERGFSVYAVEPNDEMRALGQKRTENYEKVQWFEGTGEETGQKSEIFDVVTFGSSFNVTDRSKALVETTRILKSKGHFVCMWNHRNLEDPLQKEIENIILSVIPNYDYGSRREDQTEVINKSGLFEKPQYFEGQIIHTLSKIDWIDAWRSHATLARQAGDNFNSVVNKIEDFVNKFDRSDMVHIPYTTRIWVAKKVS